MYMRNQKCEKKERLELTAHVYLLFRIGRQVIAVPGPPKVSMIHVAAFASEAAPIVASKGIFLFEETILG
jgi:hypothetical protein